MKTTGLAVAAAGILMGLFALFAGSMFQSSVNGPGSPNDAIRTGADLTVPVAFAMAAVLIGATLYLFGSRSYVATQNPAVRN